MPASAYVFSGHTAVQSEEEDEQYDEQEPPETSAATGLVHVPLGMYMPASLQVAEQVRVLADT